MPFEFQKEQQEPDEEPSGKYTYVFSKFGSDETLEGDGDTVDEAWDAVRLQSGEDWYSWRCLGRKDVLEYKADLEGYDDISDAECRITGDHPVYFASRNGEKVQAWKSNDEDTE